MQTSQLYGAILSLVLWNYWLIHWHKRSQTQRCYGSSSCGDDGKPQVTNELCADFFGFSYNNNLSSLYPFLSFYQNVDAKGLREPSLEAPRKGTEVKDDDPIIPFGTLPTVSRFGAISRTSKTGYQTTGPVQAMASTPQNPNSKHMAMPGKSPHGPQSYCFTDTGN